jgi:signal transduction histidine kinase
MHVNHSRSVNRDRSLTAITVIIAALVGVLGVVFARSDQVERLSVQATTIQDAEQVGTAIVEVRANIGISLVLASAATAGVNVEEDPDVAVAQSRRSIGELEEAASRIGSVGDITETVVLAERVLTTLEQGRIDAANELARASLLPALGELEASMNAQIERSTQIIEIEGSSAGDLARTTSLAVALIVPALAVLVVRRSLRRRAEREVLEIELEAERAQNRERDELIASLSHQIRTPLAGVYGFSEAMADFLDAGMADDSFLEEAANAIFTQSFEIRRLVDDLFVAARDDSGTLAKSIVEVDVRRAAETALEPFSRSGITAAVDVDPGVVLADNLRLQHILRNLIHNASSHGGGNIALVGRANTETYRLMVVDDGGGLGEGSPESRFTPFVHRYGKSATAGSLGLGLAVARSLAEIMNGSLVYERRNRKSWFILTLARADSASRPDEDQLSRR